MKCSLPLRRIKKPPTSHHTTYAGETEYNTQCTVPANAQLKNSAKLKGDKKSDSNSEEEPIDVFIQTNELEKY